ncbi:CDAN1-interacting nuclease 1 [Anopheles ziemanni]|uniref:CDAN1-interacting nuclease 1 n=1 Tax=Anopheles coustani TaxID=139045 RepID=UPI0026597CF5|nr:CDAN1-interacting nuclease 1 [Anopheles coustani]XP_058177914.1 CDAN1-interacting nuclease 1 [Anopheles ziemanni]
MVVLTTQEYTEIQNFVRNYNGLSTDCNLELGLKFPKYPPETLGSILAKEVLQRVKINHSKITAKAASLVKDYQTQADQTKAHDILLKMSIKLRVPSLVLCRIFLAKRYPYSTRAEIAEMLRIPDVIGDSLLAVNVGYCLYSEIMDGPITDAIRRCIGEEYEVRLKKFAREAGMVFYDERDLRRTGYDKTPDLKLAVPFLFRGQVINWIESKASFGDVDSHKRYIKDQLTSYGNRFGSGLVIYWLGFIETIADCPENGNYVLVTDQFPTQNEMEFLKFNLPESVADISSAEDVCDSLNRIKV